MKECKFPDCDCIEKAEEKNGGRPIKNYECLYAENNCLNKSQLATDGREELEKENEITVSQLRETVKELQKENINYKNYTLKAIGYKDQITALQSSLKEKEKECEELKGWKESMISVMPPIQEIGKAINVKPGESIHDKILPFIDELKKDKERWQKTTERFKAEGDKWLNKSISQSKQIEELKAENERLKMDNMTHEYNQAEAEKFAPEYKRQIEEPLLAEIERLKKENEYYLKDLKRLDGLYGHLK